MNILICDDMKSEIAKLERLLGDSGLEIKTVAFNSGYDALDYVHSGAVVDVCFLDIVMPDMSGMKLAEQLRSDGFKGEIVFLTTSNGYAEESYGVHAFSYLLKPPRPEAVRNVLRKLDDARKKDDTGGIFIKVSKVARHILFRDISYIEVIRHYVYFRLTDGEDIEIYATLGEIAEQLLSDRRFAQSHRSYIVNMSDVAAVDERQITMRSGKKIPYSKSYSDIKKKFAKWIVGGDVK